MVKALHNGRHQILKLSCVLWGEKTSITIEPEFLEILTQEREARSMNLSQLLEHIDTERDKELHPNFSSAVRLWIFNEVLAERNELLRRIRADEPGSNTADPPFALPK